METDKKETNPAKEKKEKKFKEVKDSQLLIKIPTTEFVGTDGLLYKKVEWVQPAGEVNLGSINNPKNQQIKEFKWKMPQKRKRHPFEVLFGGGD